jgi:hypothetical protein
MMASFILSHASASGSQSSCLKLVILDRNYIVFAGGKNLVINILVHSSHEVIVPTSLLLFRFYEKGNKCNCTASGLTSLINSQIDYAKPSLKG